MSARPWYRQMWPWLLMSMPAAALVGGAVMVWLATSGRDPLVVDDYYREGKAINRTLARDRAAAERGLAAVIETDVDGGVIVRLAAKPGFEPPQRLTLRIVHATREERDVAIGLARVGAQYLAPAAARLPGPGRWRIFLEDPEKTWRLTADAAGFGEPIRIAAAAPD